MLFIPESALCGSTEVRTFRSLAVTGWQLCSGEGWSAFTTIRDVISVREYNPVHLSHSLPCFISCSPLPFPPPLPCRCLSAGCCQAFSSLQASSVPHHMRANWGPMRSICFPLYVSCSVWLPSWVSGSLPSSVSLGSFPEQSRCSLCSLWRQPAAPTAMSWTHSCSAPASWDAWSPWPGFFSTGKYSSCSEHERFFS